LARRRERHRARRLGITESYRTEAAVDVPNWVTHTEHGATPSSWLPQLNGLVAAEVVYDSQEEPAREIAYPSANPYWVRRGWSRAAPTGA
jgi:hypothetical protein